MDLYKLILSRRSIRSFKKKCISLCIIKKIINSARVAPSASNLQFIEYVAITEKTLINKIFPHTKWAAYLDKPLNRLPQEKPQYFIALLINYNKSPNPDMRDIGAAAENILLSSLSFEIKSCWLGAIDKPAISKFLKLPPFLKLDSLIALGYSDEKSKIVDTNKTIKYWRDINGKHFVPKRPLEAVFNINKYGNKS